MSNNPFVLPTSEYKRDINILKHYVEDTAAYISKMSGKPYDECLQFVRDSVKPGGEFAFQDPDCMYLERQENGDREKKVGKLWVDYLQPAIRDQELIAPTFTTYLPPHVKQSLLVDFIDINVKARGVAKKAMFHAEMEGDTFMYALKKTEQGLKKIMNNSLSGAHVSASTPLYNRTAHSTLTSNCRSTSGYGNANNEKFLNGNRHYWSPDIVRNNIISIIRHSDYAAIETAMAQFGIRPPTVNETMDCITYSTNLYWRGEFDLGRIRLLVEKLTDLERAAFVYTGDLYHLMRYNESVVRKFITRLAWKADTPHPEPAKVIKAAPDDDRALAAQICIEEMRGKQMKDIAGTPTEGILAATLVNIQETIRDYAPLIKAFWVTPNMPASLAHFPDSIRRAALTSDTDSTIFTVQDWVKWHQGRVGFDAMCTAIKATMIFLASQTIVHVLARMSANFGIEEKRLHQIAMKNEFAFDAFVPTQVAKHYFALISCQEGNIFSKFKKEIKGVHLKSSNAPRAIMDEAEKMMTFIMEEVLAERKLSIKKLLTWVADIERQVVSSIKAGSHEYFRKGQIKTPESYVEKEEATPYQQFLFWNAVFGDKYVRMENPPYMSVKISVDLGTPTKTKQWLWALKDPIIVKRVEDWLEASGKKHVGNTFMVPEQAVLSGGIPEEIFAAIDVRKIVLDTTKVFYLILEVMGIFILNKKVTRLVSDHY